MLNIAVIRSVVPRLIPFFNTSLLFFLMRPYEMSPSMYAAAIKCLPILCLCGFVITYLNRGFSILTHRYTLFILAGLVFSCFGDICLVFAKQHFIHGLLFFAIAHVLYIVAFGTNPLKLSIAAVCSLVAIPLYIYMLPGLQNEMVFFSLLYTIVIFTMLWRALARINLSANVWTWTSVCACVGAFFFIFSDLCIALDKFRFQIPYKDQIVMSTYYIAQCGIAVSVVDQSASKSSNEEKKEK